MLKGWVFGCQSFVVICPTNVPWKQVWCFGCVEEERIGKGMEKVSVERSRREDENMPLSTWCFGVVFFDFFLMCGWVGV